MNEQGVPRELTTAPDFVMVRTALVRYLGGALEALAFERIRWRTQDESRAWTLHDDRRWWTIALPEFANELGCSEKQLRRALDKLTAAHAITRHHLKLNGPYDRRLSYSPVITDLPNWADRAPMRADVDPPNRADVPLQEDIQDSSGTHRFHNNAYRALLDLVAERSLPLSAEELLDRAYSLGAGDPWNGYLEVKHRTRHAITDARNPASVLRARLGADQ